MILSEEYGKLELTDKMDVFENFPDMKLTKIYQLCPSNCNENLLNTQSLDFELSIFGSCNPKN